MKKTVFNFHNSYVNLARIFFQYAPPEVAPYPQTCIVNNKVAAELGINLSNCETSALSAELCGSSLGPDTKPYCQAYAGHQFGHYRTLGDGRAHILGEHLTPNGERWDCAVKGSGRTPYSRSGDGRAVLGPMLREYIVSEAMHALGIPTTRSLAVITTGETVSRQTPLPGAILTRLARSHLRVGTFEFAAAQQDTNLIQALLKYAVERHFPELLQAENTALRFLETVIERQSQLMTHWMRVGFIHGVMNTDNVSICGDTLDYGPCAFMDEYNPNTVFSYIDSQGRYAFKNQPIIAQWNMARLAETLLPLIHRDSDKAIALATNAVNQFESLYKTQWHSMMCDKLGLTTDNKKSAALIDDLLSWMQKKEADYTNTFFDLTYQQNLKSEIYTDSKFIDWHQRWVSELAISRADNDQIGRKMRGSNPVVIPRNHQVENVLNIANHGNTVPLKKLLSVLESPYEYTNEKLDYQSPPQPHERIKNTFCGT